MNFNNFMNQVMKELSSALRQTTKNKTELQLLMGP